MKIGKAVEAGLASVYQSGYHCHHQTSNSKRRGHILLVLFLVSMCLLTRPSHASQAALITTICEDVQLAVALAEEQPVTYQVSGQFCYKPNHNNIVHLLLSGAAYGSVYWDFPLQPQHYSYVRALTHAGFATVNFDRIGIGASDHPPADQVTVEANAFVVHQMVQALRNGELGTFATVILVGHSLGSGVALVEAGQYHDVDGVILTGFLHAMGPVFAQVPSLLYPAQVDPRFTGQNIPDGYLTTRPGTRVLLYTNAQEEAHVLADPNVIALDEQTKETITVGELTTFAPVVASPSNAQALDVPVLIVNGQYDNVFCTPPLCSEAQVEASYYPPAAQVAVQVIPNAGHNLNLHPNAYAFFSQAIAWSNQHFKGCETRLRGCLQGGRERKVYKNR